jgi:hypothetical protein
MIDDGLRRQADVFTELVELQAKVGRDPSGVRPGASRAIMRRSSCSARPPGYEGAKATTWMIERLALETRERRRPTTSMPSASAWTTAYCLPRYSISFDARLAGGRRLRPVACRDLGAPQPHHMAALVSEAALLGTRSARQRLLEPPDRSMLRPAHDREVNRRVRFARAFHLEETEAGIQCVAKSRRRLRRGRRIASRDKGGLRPQRDSVLLLRSPATRGPPETA